MTVAGATFVGTGIAELVHSATVAVVGKLTVAQLGDSDQLAVGVAGRAPAQRLRPRRRGQCARLELLESDQIAAASSAAAAELRAHGQARIGRSHR